VRIAIIGCGSIGRRHAFNARTLGVDVVPVDVNHTPAAGLAFDLGVMGWSEELRAFDGVDAVLICTPAATHVAVAESLLRQGYKKALYVEKPLATSVAEADIFRTWPHPVTMVGYNLRFHEAVEYLRAVRPNGGDLTLECDSRLWPGSSYAGLLEECSHEIDLALYLGAPDHVEVGHLSDHEAIFRLGEGWRIRLNDRADHYYRRWDVFSETRGSSMIFSKPTALGDEMYLKELRHFLACVESGAPTLTPFAEGLRVVEICERVKELATV
jgi:predicted dehydrogenase